MMRAAHNNNNNYFLMSKVLQLACVHVSGIRFVNSYVARVSVSLNAVLFKFSEYRKMK